MNRPWIVAAGALVVLVAYLALAYKLEDRERHGTVTVFNRRAAGLSVFHEWKNRVSLGSAEYKRTAFLETAGKKEGVAVFLLSPSVPLSPREAKRLDEFLKGGGTIIVSFHDRVGYFNLSPLLAKAEASISLSDNPLFQNGRTDDVRAGPRSAWYPPGSIASFYSPLWLAPDCGAGLDCYFREVRRGKGQLLVFAGLPPFSNGLIMRGDNAKLALALAFPRVVLDEYHHLFSERTLLSLLAEPSFAVPVAGLTFLLILVFAFGYTPFTERTALAEPARRVPSFHEWNESLWRGLAAGATGLPTLLRQHAVFLRRKFPERAGDVARVYGAKDSEAPVVVGKNEALRRSAELAKLHQRWLKERGRIR